MESPEPELEDIPVGIVLATSSSMNSAFFLPEKVEVIVEGNVIITMPTLAEGYIYFLD